MVAEFMKWGGAIALAGGLWTYADKTDMTWPTKKQFAQLQMELQEVSKSTLLLRFQFLQAKKESGGGLSFDEEQERCRIAVVLKYVNVGC